MRDTSTEKVTSSQIPMAYGVLQGSVFWRVFLLIIMNDHNETIKKSIICYFTDDTLETYFTVTSHLKTNQYLKLVLKLPSGHMSIKYQSVRPKQKLLSFDRKGTFSLNISVLK